MKDLVRLTYLHSYDGQLMVIDVPRDELLPEGPFIIQGLERYGVTISEVPKVEEQSA